MVTYHDYHPGHCWFYKLGGKRLSLKAIRASVMQSGYIGYMREDIDKADALPEPKRSIKLREFKAKVMQDLASDIARYRQCARELAQHRKIHGQIDENECADIFVSISLKHNHIYNDFAHLITLKKLLNKQPSLFDF